MLPQKKDDGTILVLSYAKIQIVLQALLELPAKHSMPIMEDINAQVLRFNKEPAAVAAEVTAQLAVFIPPPIPEPPNQDAPHHPV